MRRCEPELIEFLAPLYDGDPSPTDRLEHFVAENGERLHAVVANYDDAISPIVRQPEAFVLWERLDNDAVAVLRLWQDSAYPIEFLASLATIWNIDLPDL